VTQEAGTPPGFWDRIQQNADRAVAAAMRSGPLKNASISDGGLTIKGGFLKLLSKVVDGVSTFYVGPSGGTLGDGTVQQVLLVRRADNSLALSLYDAFPDTDGTLNQALSWWDRFGNTVLADDTDSGQGLARPWLSGGFSRTRFADMSVATASTTFETVCDALVNRQQPRWEVGIRASMDTPGATGEVRVLVDGQQLGSTSTEAFAVSTRYYGPSAILGTYGQDALVEIQARVTSGTGGLRLEPRFCRTRQS
jgi:hypothetical protein